MSLSPHPLQKTADTLGTPLLPQEYDKHRETGSSPSSQELISKYGSWQQALESVGKGNAVGWSEEQLVMVLSEIDAKVDGYMSRSTYNEEKRDYYPSAKPFRRNFGSWTDAIREAGCSVKEQYTNYNWSKEDCINALIDVSRSIDRRLTIGAYQEHRENGTHPDYSTIYNKLGSWNEAKNEAGIDCIKTGGEREYTEQECIQAVQDVASSIQGRLSLTKYNKNKSHTHPSRRNICVCCGSWNACKQKAGLTTLDSPEEREISKEDCLAALKEVANRTQYYVSRRVYNDVRDNTHPNARTIEKKFECWTDAREEAGISTDRDYRSPESRWYGPDWNEVTNRIRDRDNHTCQNCGLPENEHEAEYDMPLHVHHIISRSAFQYDYETANHESNLVALCVSCHGQFNWVPVDIQCEKLGISQPNVEPAQVDVTEEDNPYRYHLRQAADYADRKYYESLTPKQYHSYASQTDAPSLKSVFESFHTWSEALDLACIPQYKQGIMPSTCINIIQENTTANSETLTLSKFKQYVDDISVAPIRRNFGTWETAKWIAGIEEDNNAHQDTAVIEAV